jgi:uncharacterized lipoprotein YbaY
LEKIHQIRGKILLGKDMVSFSEAVINVSLLDISQIDAPSRMIAKQTIRGTSHTKDMEEYLPFDLYAENLDKKIDYTIRVHISLHDSNEVTAGDYVTTESFPISLEENLAPIAIAVQEVR